MKFGVAASHKYNEFRLSIVDTKLNHRITRRMKGQSSKQ